MWPRGTIKYGNQKIEIDGIKFDFNWDFEKNKSKHKSYIALEDIIKMINSIK